MDKERMKEKKIKRNDNAKKEGKNNRKEKRRKIKYKIKEGMKNERNYKTTRNKFPL